MYFNFFVHYEIGVALKATPNFDPNEHSKCSNNLLVYTVETLELTSHPDE